MADRTDPDGEMKPPNNGGRLLTESEFRAWMDRRMRDYADHLTEQCAPYLPDGCRFEWPARAGNRE